MVLRYKIFIPKGKIAETPQLQAISRKQKNLPVIQAQFRLGNIHIYYCTETGTLDCHPVLLS